MTERHLLTKIERRSRLLGGQRSVRIQHEFFGRTMVEVAVALRRILQSDHGSVNCLGDMHLVMQDAHHQLAVVTHHGALTRGESMTFCPAQANADTEHANLRIFVNPARVTGDVESGYSQGAARTSDIHY